MMNPKILKLADPVVMAASPRDIMMAVSYSTINYVSTNFSHYITFYGRKPLQFGCPTSHFFKFLNAVT
jgi:hypothetical protein